MKEGKAGRGVFYSFSVGLISLASSLLLFPIAVTTVGSAQYGSWLFIIAVSSYFSYADLGVGVALVHFCSRIRGGESSLTVASLISAALVWTTGVVIFSTLTAFLLFQLYVSHIREIVSLTVEEMDTLIWCGVALVALTWIRPMTSVLHGEGRFILERKFQLAGLIVRVAGTLYACLFLSSFSALVIAETFAVTLPIILAAVVVLKRHIRMLRIGKSTAGTLRIMIRFSLRSLIVSLAGNSILQGGTLVVGLVTGPNQVTYYNAAFRIYTGLRQINAFMIEPFRSMLSRTFFHDFDRAVCMSKTLVRVSTTILTVGSLSVIFAAQPILNFWLGDSVPIITVSEVLVVLLLGLMLNSFHGVLIVASDAAGQPGLFAREQLLWVVLFFALAFTLGPPLGALGVSVALSAPLIIVEFLYIWRAQKLMSVKPGEWWGFCFMPLLKLCFPGVVVAVLFSLNTVSSNANSLLPSCVFIFVTIIMFLLLRNSLPWRDLRELLSSKL